MKPIKRTSVTDQVVTNLKQFITSNDLSVGDKLPTEAALCEMMRVSRTTIREAMRILQALGYIEMRHGRGAFVVRKSGVDSEDIIVWYKEHQFHMSDIMDVRMAVEPLAVRLAIGRSTDKEIAQLERIHARYEKAYKEADPIGLCTNSELFHNKIVEMTHNELLIGINKKIADAFIEYRCRGYGRKVSRDLAIQSHRIIMEAFKTRNLELGVEEMNNHLHNIRKITLDLVELDRKK